MFFLSATTESPHGYGVSGVLRNTILRTTLPSSSLNKISLVLLASSLIPPVPRLTALLRYLFHLLRWTSMELHQPSIISTVEAIVNFLIWPSITTTTMMLLSSSTTSMYSNHHSLSSAFTSLISALLTVPLPVNILVVVDIPVEFRVSHFLVADRALRAADRSHPRDLFRRPHHLCFGLFICLSFTPCYTHGGVEQFFSSLRQRTSTLNSFSRAHQHQASAVDTTHEQWWFLARTLSLLLLLH